MKKSCPKCGEEHEKNGIYCSRSCANSRTWSDEDKLKKSKSAKNSTKVLEANRNEEKLKRQSILAIEQNKRGDTVWEHLRTKEVTDKVKQSLKKRSEEWLSSLDRSEYKDYRKLCKFTFSLNDYPNHFNFGMIEEYGWYKPKNKGDNQNGVSRDHMYSISEGFKNNVDPYYISHPANCQLLRHSDNFKKKGKCSISLDELIKRVNDWDEKHKG